MDKPLSNNSQDQAGTEAKPNDPAQEIEKLRVKAEEYLAGWQRAKADYLNLRKQTEREKEELVGFATGAMVLELLPVKTNFDRAWEHLPQELASQSWVEGISHIRQQLNDILAAVGITTIKPDNQDFNPEEHEAVERAHDDQTPEQRVLRTVEPGYKLRGQVIIPAKVAVSLGPVNKSNEAAVDQKTKGGEK